jgi:hypothetical protein
VSEEAIFFLVRIASSVSYLMRMGRKAGRFDDEPVWCHAWGERSFHRCIGFQVRCGNLLDPPPHTDRVDSGA